MKQFIDSHAHIQKDFYGDGIDEVIKRSKDAGVIAIVSIGTSLAESAEMLDLAKQYPNYIFPTVGLHPEDAANDLAQFSAEELAQKVCVLAADPQVVAIGECGLDYGKADEIVPADTKQRQRELFEMQIKIAHDLSLPLIVHCRNAWDDTFALLENYSDLPVVLHSFTGNLKIAETAIDRGYMISFSGIVTFKSAKDIQEAAAIIAQDSILIETDSPFLTPEPMRGAQNEPKNIVNTATYLATLRKTSLDELALNTAKNAQKVFKISQKS